MVEFLCSTFVEKVVAVIFIGFLVEAFLAGLMALFVMVYEIVDVLDIHHKKSFH